MWTIRVSLLRTHFPCPVFLVLSASCYSPQFWLSAPLRHMAQAAPSSLAFWLVAALSPSDLAPPERCSRATRSIGVLYRHVKFHLVLILPLGFHVGITFSL